MIWYLLLIVGIATLLYAAVPAVGAFVARGQWRTFRRTIVAASRYPSATPAAVGREHAPTVGFHRFFGSLEAIQGNDRIWITNGRFSLAADLRGTRVYVIPEADGGQGAPGGNAPGAPEDERAAADSEIRSVPWSRIFSLPEGTPVFVGGALFAEDGRGVFRDRRRTRLLVILHDCPREAILPRAIGSGRQRNEFMNSFTLPSVAIGSLSLFLLSFSLLALHEPLLAVASLTAGLAPFTPFLPPGVPLYFAYRRYWKKARSMRAQRDVVRLPLRYFPPSQGGIRKPRATLLPDMEPYLMIPGTVSEGDPNAIVSGGERIELPPGMRRIDVDLPARRGGRRTAVGDCVAFTAYREDGGELRVEKPADPMADQVLVPGDPQALSRASERTAREYEAISALFILLDVALNLPLVFLLLSLLLR